MKSTRQRGPESRNLRCGTPSSITSTAVVCAHLPGYRSSCAPRSAATTPAPAPTVGTSATAHPSRSSEITASMQSGCRPQLFSACRVTVLAGRKHGQRNLCGVGALVVCQNSFLVSRASQSDPAACSYQEHRLRAERSGGRAPHSEQRHNMQSKTQDNNPS